MTELILFIAVLVFAFLSGNIGQSRHYQSIETRELMLRNILIFNEKITHPRFSGHEFALVSGSVVMGSDYFRQVLAFFKMLVGGRVTSFEAMMDRGRREAILRMKEEAQKMGASAIFNVRLETSTISEIYSRKGGGLACVELIAYGTAWKAPDKNHLE